MSAERVRQAAERLSRVVDKLTTDTERWDEAFPVDKVYADCSTYERVFVHPAVVLAVADLLESLAFDRETNGEIDGRSWDHGIVPLADLILGGAS